MKKLKWFILIFIGSLVLSSCSVVEKASKHGMQSGVYRMKTSKEASKKVYVELQEERLTIYPLKSGAVDTISPLVMPMGLVDSMVSPMTFVGTSFDLDLSSIILKYRPSVHGESPQLNTDYNLALFGGYRYDYFVVKDEKCTLRQSRRELKNRGFDFGLFAGLGTTLITPFTTDNKLNVEYSGAVVQYGVAGFVESHVASFGIAVGCDYLTTPDRSVWIYQNKPWIGFVVGIALN